jgi:exopolyphosphatase/guanosine-5'-triphosphate,3'-diphosphate pyrophosphatase
MARVRVGVVDVGANTLRLLVADVTARGLEPVREERRRTRLGEDVERFGRLTEAKIERSSDAARKEVRRARRLGCAKIEILVTSPWRNASNGTELVEALAAATGERVRALEADEEGQLGLAGAIARTPVDGEPLAVCDVGGGSTQLVVAARSGPTWLRSIELGSLQLTVRWLRSDPPRPAELRLAREQAAEALGSLTPPLPAAALATGGSARALRRFGLERLDEQSHAAALDELVSLPRPARAERIRSDLERARTLTAGAIILAEVQRLLRVPLSVAYGGVREGACLDLLQAELAAA